MAKTSKGKAKKVTPKKRATTGKGTTIIELLRRKEGATLADLTKATGWQAHYADVRIMPTCVGNPVCGAGIAAMESA